MRHVRPSRAVEAVELIRCQEGMSKMHDCTRMRQGVLLCVLVSGICSLAVAGPFDEYIEFRYHSGVPGNQSGVTIDGKVGADGAVQMAIPLAFTPCSGNYTIDANVGCDGGGMKFDYKGPDVNGTLNFGLGFGNPGHGVCVGYMGTSDEWEPVYNLQWQIRPYDEYGPAVAIGGIDLTNQRAASAKTPFAGDARSYYVVVTDQVASDEKPIYMTLGAGSGRFEGAFGGLCYRVNRRLAVAAEYDTLGINGGISYGFSRPEKNDNLVFFVGIADLRQMTYGLTYTIGK